MLEAFIEGAILVFTPIALLLLVAGVLVGVLMGSIPGMTATMTVAVLVSFTFAMEPIEGMMLLLGIYGGALYAGSIPAIIIRTPGTPSAAATVFDGYPLAQRGEAGRAIGIATVASVIGGATSVVILAIFAPQVAQIALNFRSPEFFALAVFGLTIIASISGDSVVKGVISGLLGMLIATVGLDPVVGTPRFTFGTTALTAGFAFIAVMIGLFGVAEGLNYYRKGIEQNAVSQDISGTIPSWEDLRTISATSLGSGLVGSLIGAIPGAGGDMASFVTYNEAKRWISDGTPEFGDGNIRGIAAAESGNNGSTGGALIPTLTLGIPGDAVSAILIGALLVHGITPGPGMFESDASIVYGIFIGFFLVYLVILVVGFLGAHVWVRLISFPPRLLWPSIFLLCVVGSIALRGNTFDAWVVIFAGIVGYVLLMQEYPLVPLVLGMILSPIAESNFRRSLQISDGSFAIFYTSPIAFTILILSALSLLYPFIQRQLTDS